MKKLICILLLSTLNKAEAQSKKDNTILVHGAVSYADLKEKLFKLNFLPATSDTTFILTNSRGVGSIGELKLLINKGDTVTIIKGQMSAQAMGMNTGPMVVENAGMKGGASREGFNIMKELALSFGFPVTYEKR